MCKLVTSSSLLTHKKNREIPTYSTYNNVQKQCNWRNYCVFLSERRKYKPHSVDRVDTIAPIHFRLRSNDLRSCKKRFRSIIYRTLGKPGFLNSSSGEKSLNSPRPWFFTAISRKAVSNKNPDVAPRHPRKTTDTIRTDNREIKGQTEMADTLDLTTLGTKGECLS